MQLEKFVPIIGFEETYLISNYGNIFSNNVNRIMSPTISNRGYKQIQLCKNRISQHFLVHRLVAMHFVLNPNPNIYNVVNHKDENQLNNYFENLEWATQAGNLQYSYRSRTEPTHSVLSEEQVLEIFRLTKETNLTDKEIGEMFGVSYGTIYKIRVGDNWNNITHHHPIQVIRFDTGDVLDKDKNYKHGEDHHKSKLSNMEIIEIYKLATEGLLSQYEISSRYNITPAQVSNIKNKKSSSQLTDEVDKGIV